MKKYVLLINLFIIIPCYSAVIYVDTDATGNNNGSNWTHAYVYLQDALSAASNGDQVWVAEGIYYPDLGAEVILGNRLESFELFSEVELYGGFDGDETSLSQRDWENNITILSGAINTSADSDNSFCIIECRTEALLDGLAITEGYSESWLYQGPGLYGNNSDGMIVRNCTFSSNHSTSAGGAVYLNYADDCTFINCVFQENIAAVSSYGGGAIFISGDDLTLIGCTFTENYSQANGGAIYNNMRFNSTLINCTFSGNSAAFNGGAIYNAIGHTQNTYLINCSFSGNSAGINGGAIFNDGISTSLISLINCTIAGNDASDEAGGIYNDIGLTLANCIIWNNTDSGPTDETAQIQGSVTATYSCIKDTKADSTHYPGTGNIDDDPLFVTDPDDGGDGWDPDDTNDNYGDLHLLPDSPCIDAGSNAALPADTEDLDNDTNITEKIPYDSDLDLRRIDGDSNGTAVVDMGSDELLFAGDDDVDNGESTTLNPDGGGGTDPMEDSLVTFENTTGGDNATVTVTEIPNQTTDETGAFFVADTTLVVETNLTDGQYSMTLVIPFDLDDLNGANPLDADLMYYDTGTTSWVLAVSKNTGGAGARWQETNPDPEPSLTDLEARPLGDYGVYWNTVDKQGFVWANVDHTTNFAFGVPSFYYGVWGGNVKDTASPNWMDYFLSIDLQAEYSPLGNAVYGETITVSGEYNYYVIVSHLPLNTDAVEGSTGNYYSGSVISGATDNPSYIKGETDNQYATIGSSDLGGTFRGFIIIDNPGDWLSLIIHTDPDGELPVNFNDPNLKSAIEEELDILNPTPDDMKNLINLNANNLEISDLSGIEHAVNITGLSLDNNIINDISPLADLIQLENLSITDNAISDISILQNFVNLINLYLANNQISDIDSLRNLYLLEELGLEGNQISDVNDLSEMINLSYLNLSQNQVNNLSDILWPSILEILVLAKNQIVDLSTVLWPSTLEKLDFNDNFISDIYPITSLTNLDELWLGGNPLNLFTYCEYLTLIQDNNPGLLIHIDPNPNPLTNNCSTNLSEFADLSNQWMVSPCNEPDWCQGCDLDQNGVVNPEDFLIFAQLWLSDFPDTCIVPDVAGLDESSAIDLITLAYNFSLGNIEYEFNSIVPDGDVISQNPAGGSIQVCDSIINIVVSEGPCPPCDDPNGLWNGTFDSDILDPNCIGVIKNWFINANGNTYGQWEIDSLGEAGIISFNPMGTYTYSSECMLQFSTTGVAFESGHGTSSAFTLDLEGTINGDIAEGTYGITFSDPNWPAYDSGNWQVTLSNDLVGYWSMDDNAENTTVLDSSRNGNDGIAQQNTSLMNTSGYKNGALTFNGSSDYIDLDSPDILDDLPANDFTVSVWINADSSSDIGTIIGSSHDSVSGWLLRKHGTTNSRISFLARHSESHAKVYTDLGSIATDVWAHVAAVWDADTKEVKIYINGSEPSYSIYETGSGTYNSDASYNKEIGIRAVDSSQQFKGKIDEMMIFNRVLDPAEILNLYNN